MLYKDRNQSALTKEIISIGNHIKDKYINMEIIDVRYGTLMHQRAIMMARLDFPCCFLI